MKIKKQVVADVLIFGFTAVFLGWFAWLVFTIPAHGPNGYSPSAPHDRSLYQGYLSSNITDPIRWCPGNDLSSSKVENFRPCLAHVMRATLKNGTVNITQPVDGYGLIVAETHHGTANGFESSYSTLVPQTGTDRVFGIFIRINGGGWFYTPEINYVDPTAGYQHGLTYEIVVATYDPRGPEYNSSNVTVPFAWSDMMWQIMYGR